MIERMVEVERHRFLVKASFVSEGQVYQEGTWYFQDEAETLQGPYPSKDEVDEAFKEHCRWLES